MRAAFPLKNYELRIAKWLCPAGSRRPTPTPTVVPTALVLCVIAKTSNRKSQQISWMDELQMSELSEINSVSAMCCPDKRLKMMHGSGRTHAQSSLRRPVMVLWSLCSSENKETVENPCMKHTRDSLKTVWGLFLCIWKLASEANRLSAARPVKYVWNDLMLWAKLNCRDAEVGWPKHAQSVYQWFGNRLTGTRRRRLYYLIDAKNQTDLRSTADLSFDSALCKKQWGLASCLSRCFVEPSKCSEGNKYKGGIKQP